MAAPSKAIQRQLVTLVLTDNYTKLLCPVLVGVTGKFEFKYMYVLDPKK